MELICVIMSGFAEETLQGREEMASQKWALLVTRSMAFFGERDTTRDGRTLNDAKHLKRPHLCSLLNQTFAESASKFEYLSICAYFGVDCINQLHQHFKGPVTRLANTDQMRDIIVIVAVLLFASVSFMAFSIISQ